MVIQCPHCQACFKLSQNKVKPGGTKVRCTKCKSIFIVTPPNGDAPREPGGAGGGQGRSSLEGNSLFQQRLGEDFEGADFFSDGDEGDQFLLDDGSAAGDESDFFPSLDDETGSDDDFLSSADDEAGGGDELFPAADDETGGDDDFFSSADDETGGGDELFPAVDDETGGDELFPAIDDEAGNQDELFPATDGEAGGPAPSPWSEGTAESPLIPNDTDSFASQDADSSLGSGLALADEEEPEIDAAVSGVPAEEPFFEEMPSRVPLPAPRPPSECRKQFPWGRVWLLLLLLSLACGFYVYQARQQLATSWQQLLIGWQLVPAPPAETGGLRPVKLVGYYVANKREGRLFVIQGEVLNEATEARAAIVVEGVLYDRAGRLLAQQKAFCGNPIGKEQLRSWPMMRMDERMQNQFGEMLANLNLGPQKAIPFTLVFKELSGTVAEFEVTVAASEAVIR